MALPIPNTFSPNTTILSSEVNANFTAVANKFNGNIQLAELQAAVPNTWLRLATAANRKVAWGTVTTASFANGKAASGTISHGLGATPVSVQLTADSIAVFNGTLGTSAVAVSVQSLSSSQIGFWCDIVDGLSNNAGLVRWTAIA